MNGDLDLSKPVIVSFHVLKLHQENHEIADVDISYDVNLTSKNDFCLYPLNVDENLNIEAAFMQTDKQKLVREDGTEIYLSTMWFYYDDGSFRQYALTPEDEGVLFSTGDYSINGAFDDPVSILTIHRTQKYADGIGLSAYDSMHDYVIGELDFLRIFPVSEKGN